MRYSKLREEVCVTNREISRTGLAILTWGNASAVDRDEGVMVIKPSGVDYEILAPEDLVVLALDSGEVVDGTLRPSSDTPTHLHLYRAFEEVGSIIHTHSHYATCWAQACREIPCLGTTHADHFHGPVPLARALTREEIEGEYEHATGCVIEERFKSAGLNPMHFPGVLVSNHGPFAWGGTPAKALANALALEEIARMAATTLSINPEMGPVPNDLLDKHFTRKHGDNAYYGQK